MLLADQPNPVEYLSWWGSLVSTLLTGLGTVVSIFAAYWTWKQQRGDAGSAKPATSQPASKKPPIHAADAKAPAVRVPVRPALNRAEGAAPAASTAAVASRRRHSSRPRLTALRVLIVVSVTLTLAFVSSIVGFVQAARMIRAVSYGQLAAVSGDLPGHRSVDACGNGFCPTSDHWVLTDGRRHIEVGFAGLDSVDTTKAGKATLTLSARGCRPGLQIAWQAILDGQVSASGTAGPEAVTAVLDVKPRQRMTMIIDSIAYRGCTVDVQSSWTVMFAPDELWNMLKGKLPHAPAFPE
ncbi:hypothetical protein [Actinoplanes sp. NPDC049599]|uniref:hypothetical protein n=1 Tax=Actinoplanes sp. NPDC049599 TaxID=3363903 RepID=UPI00378F82CE